MTLPKTTKLFLVLTTIMMIVLFPRFDRIDRFGIDQFTTKGLPAAAALADARKYINHVRYFRGEVDDAVLRAPWAYRPLPTYLASLLPLKPMTGINAVNFIFLCIGLFFLLKTLALIGLSSIATKLGGLGYVLSFPVFFYGAIGYIDPVLVGMLSVGQYLILTQRNVLFFMLLGLGAFVKDPYIIILPAWAAYQYSLSRTPWIRVLSIVAVSALALVLFVFTIYLIRIVTPVDSGFFWSPQQAYLDFNLYRKNAWITWLATFGPMGFMACWYCINKNTTLLKSPTSLSLAVGLAGAVAVLIYSYFSVYVDGRYIWIAYPFMIPLACQYWDERVLKIRTD